MLKDNWHYKKPRNHNRVLRINLFVYSDTQNSFIEEWIWWIISFLDTSLLQHTRNKFTHELWIFLSSIVTIVHWTRSPNHYFIFTPNHEIQNFIVSINFEILEFYIRHARCSIIILLGEGRPFHYSWPPKLPTRCWWYCAHNWNCLFLKVLKFHLLISIANDECVDHWWPVLEHFSSIFFYDRDVCLFICLFFCLFVTFIIMLRW